jgi:hypothetical protein
MSPATREPAPGAVGVGAVALIAASDASADDPDEADRAAILERRGRGKGPRRLQ